MSSSIFKRAGTIIKNVLFGRSTTAKPPTTIKIEDHGADRSKYFLYCFITLLFKENNYFYFIHRLFCRWYEMLPNTGPKE